MAKSLQEHAESLAKEMARDMRDESPRNIVGGADNSEFEFEGKNYMLSVEAFWEKSNWGEYELRGIGFDYKYKSEMFYF